MSKRPHKKTSAKSTGVPGRAATLTLLALAAVYVIAANLTPISESDFWIQLRVGDEIRESGAIPKTIEYAFTEAQDRPFVAHEWLSSVLTSSLYEVVGYGGMIVFKCALATAVAGLLFALAWRICRDPIVSALIACAAATVMNFRFQMRPEIFAFLLALASLHCLLGFARSGRIAWLAALLPVSLVWANSHGSFVLNLLLPWVFLLGAVVDDLRSKNLQRERVFRTYLPFAAAGLAIALASLVNPYGLRMITHSVEFGGADWLRDNFVEFGSTFGPRTRGAAYFWVYIVYLGILAVSVARGFRRLDGASLLLLGLFGWMSADAIRFTAWFAIAGTYAMAHAVASERSPAHTRKIALAGSLALTLGIVVAALHGDVRGHRIGFRNEAPMSPEALVFVREAGISGNVFNTFSHGDQLIHAFYPEIRVVIDSRVDAYGKAYYLLYRSLAGRSFDALGSPGELVAFLDRWRVATIVTRPLDFKNWQDKGHADALSRAGFGLAYSDATTLVLRRAPR